MSIAENIKNVRERVNAACLRAGRDPKEVTLISVSKTKPVSKLMRPGSVISVKTRCRRSRKNVRRSRRMRDSI